MSILMLLTSFLTILVAEHFIARHAVNHPHHNTPAARARQAATSLHA
jgi:hypothetical protein